MIVTRKRISKIDNIADDMRKRIINGELSPDTPLASSRELAARFNVSPMTADRAIRKLVSEGLLKRFKGSGTFIQKNSFSSKKQWRIGYCDNFSVPFQYFHQKLIDDFYIEPGLKKLKNNNCTVELISYKKLLSQDFCDNELHKLDALIISKALVDDNTLKSILTFKGPVLLYRQQHIVDLPFYQVVPDWHSSIENIFKCINPERFKKFIVLTSHSPNIVHRANVFIKRAKLEGIKDSQIEMISIKILPGQSPQLYGSKFGQQLKSASETFIFTTSDLIAFGILDAFYERRLSNDQFELVSCDNLEARGICPFGEPVLTTIEHPKEEITCCAIDFLMDVLNKKDSSIFIKKIPTKLIIRKSGLTHKGGVN